MPLYIRNYTASKYTIYVETFEGHGGPQTLGLRFVNKRPVFVNTKSNFFLYSPWTIVGILSNSTAAFWAYISNKSSKIILYASLVLIDHNKYPGVEVSTLRFFWNSAKLPTLTIEYSAQKWLISQILPLPCQNKPKYIFYTNFGMFRPTWQFAPNAEYWVFWNSVHRHGRL